MNVNCNFHRFQLKPVKFKNKTFAEQEVVQFIECSPPENNEK